MEGSEISRTVGKTTVDEIQRPARRKETGVSAKAHDHASGRPVLVAGIWQIPTKPYSGDDILR